MIVVKIEIWPFGDEAAAREIARANIWNTGGGTSDYGEYGAKIIEPDTSTEISGIKFRAWPRRLGALRLVAEIFRHAGLLREFA